MNRKIKRHTVTKRKVSVLLLVGIGIILVFLIVALILVITKGGSGSGAGLSASEEISVSSQISSEESSETESSVPESVSQPESSEKEPSKTDNNSTVETSSREEISETTQSHVTETPAPSNDYFADTCFIGDSRTQGLMLYSGLDSTFYAGTGLNVKTVFSTACVNINGQSYTVLDALKTRSFKRVYVSFGINEVGWPSADGFINYYEDLITQIKQLQPNATICVQSILPVSATRSAKGDSINNEQIASRNQLIKAMAARLSVTYLDITSAVCGDSGTLPADAGGDGIHLNAYYCKLWANYLAEHPIS